MATFRKAKAGARRASREKVGFARLPTSRQTLGPIGGLPLWPKQRPNSKIKKELEYDPPPEMLDFINYLMLKDLEEFYARTLGRVITAAASGARGASHPGGGEFPRGKAAGRHDRSRLPAGPGVPWQHSQRKPREAKALQVWEGLPSGVHGPSDVLPQLFPQRLLRLRRQLQV